MIYQKHLRFGHMMYVSAENADLQAFGPFIYFLRDSEPETPAYPGLRESMLVD